MSGHNVHPITAVVGHLGNICTEIVRCPTAISSSAIAPIYMHGAKSLVLNEETLLLSIYANLQLLERDYDESR